MIIQILILTKRLAVSKKPDTKPWNSTADTTVEFHRVEFHRVEFHRIKPSELLASCKAALNDDRLKTIVKDMRSSGRLLK